MANPNPKLHTENLKPFKPGQSGNPGGKTKEQRRLEIENAERATRLRNRMLAGLEAELEQAQEDGDAAAVKMITQNILKLLKDAEDRGLGNPEQSLSHTSPDGTMAAGPTVIQVVGVDPDDQDPEETGASIQ